MLFCHCMQNMTRVEIRREQKAVHHINQERNKSVKLAYCCLLCICFIVL